jgi:hypothetical protein
LHSRGDVVETVQRAAKRPIHETNSPPIIVVASVPIADRLQKINLSPLKTWEICALHGKSLLALQRRALLNGQHTSVA